MPTYPLKKTDWSASIDDTIANRCWVENYVLQRSECLSGSCSNASASHLNDETSDWPAIQRERVNAFSWILALESERCGHRLTCALHTVSVSRSSPREWPASVSYLVFSAWKSGNNHLELSFFLGAEMNEEDLILARAIVAEQYDSPNGSPAPLRRFDGAERKRNFRWGSLFLELEFVSTFVLEIVISRRDVYLGQRCIFDYLCIPFCSGERERELTANRLDLFIFTMAQKYIFLEQKRVVQSVLGYMIWGSVVKLCQWLVGWITWIGQSIN